MLLHKLDCTQTMYKSYWNNEQSLFGGFKAFGISCRLHEMLFWVNITAAEWGQDSKYCNEKYLQIVSQLINHYQDMNIESKWLIQWCSQAIREVSILLLHSYHDNPKCGLYFHTPKLHKKSTIHIHKIGARRKIEMSYIKYVSIFPCCWSSHSCSCQTNQKWSVCCIYHINHTMNLFAACLAPWFALNGRSETYCLEVGLHEKVMFCCMYLLFFNISGCSATRYGSQYHIYMHQQHLNVTTQVEKWFEYCKEKLFGSIDVPF